MTKSVSSPIRTVARVHNQLVLLLFKGDREQRERMRNARLRAGNPAPWFTLLWWVFCGTIFWFNSCHDGEAITVLLVGGVMGWCMLVIPLWMCWVDILASLTRRPNPIYGETDWRRVRAIEQEIYGRTFHTGKGEIIPDSPESPGIDCHPMTEDHDDAGCHQVMTGESSKPRYCLPD